MLNGLTEQIPQWFWSDLTILSIKIGPPMQLFLKLIFVFAGHTQGARRKWNLQLTYKYWHKSIWFYPISYEGYFWILGKKKVRILILGNLINRDEIELKHIFWCPFLYDPYFAYFPKGFRVELFYLTIGTNPFIEHNTNFHYHIPEFSL